MTLAVSALVFILTPREYAIIVFSHRQTLPYFRSQRSMAEYQDKVLGSL